MKDFVFGKLVPAQGHREREKMEKAPPFIEGKITGRFRLNKASTKRCFCKQKGVAFSGKLKMREKRKVGKLRKGPSFFHGPLS